MEQQPTKQVVIACLSWRITGCHQDVRATLCHKNYKEQNLRRLHAIPVENTSISTKSQAAMGK
jgi:hypothetical protein